MLTLITGRGKSGKTRLLLEAVKACPTTQMASRIVLVPEQLSHETERLLSELCGDSISFTAEVLSFTRLCDRVFARSGGGARPILDQVDGSSQHGWHWTAFGPSSRYSAPQRESRSF